MIDQKIEYLKKIPVLKEDLVLREEDDDWALTFDPDTGNTYGLNPTGVRIFKLIDGKTSIEDIISRISSEYEDTPASVDIDVIEFVSGLVEKEFAFWS